MKRQFKFVFAAALVLVLAEKGQSLQLQDRILNVQIGTEKTTNLVLDNPGDDLYLLAKSFKDKYDEVKVGMSMKEVKKILGKPKNKTKVSGQSVNAELWVYTSGGILRKLKQVNIFFDKDGKLLSI